MPLSGWVSSAGPACRCVDRVARFDRYHAGRMRSACPPTQRPNTSNAPSQAELIMARCRDVTESWDAPSSRRRVGETPSPNAPRYNSHSTPDRQQAIFDSDCDLEMLPAAAAFATRICAREELVASCTVDKAPLYLSTPPFLGLAIDASSIYSRRAAHRLRSPMVSPSHCTFLSLPQKPGRCHLPARVARRGLGVGSPIVPPPSRVCLSYGNDGLFKSNMPHAVVDAPIVSLACTNGAVSNQSPSFIIFSVHDADNSIRGSKVFDDSLATGSRDASSSSHASLPALSFFKSAPSGSTQMSPFLPPSLVRHVLSLQHGGIF
jgi:hypothetical protein